MVTDSAAVLPRTTLLCRHSPALYPAARSGGQPHPGRMQRLEPLWRGVGLFWAQRQSCVASRWGGRKRGPGEWLAAGTAAAASGLGARTASTAGIGPIQGPIAPSTRGHERCRAAQGLTQAQNLRERAPAEDRRNAGLEAASEASTQSRRRWQADGSAAAELWAGETTATRS